MNGIEIIPTNTCPHDLDELTRRAEIFAAFAPQVHLDISDGKFTPVLSWPYGSAQWTEANALGSLPFSDRSQYEAHLMVEDPSELGAILAKAKCTRVIGHIEAFGSADETIAALERWKREGAREVGLALLIDTELELLEPLAHHCDSVLLMSIATLGSQGAAFDERVFGRIEALHTMHPELMIAVDGGVSGSNIESLVRAGARRFGVGSAISKAPDPAEAYRSLLERAESALQ